jgi:Zn finger protein HypA/HybF involved in hydrogenase expression
MGQPEDVEMADTEQAMDMNTEMMLDGNAVAGALQAIFGVEMTTTSLVCAQCGGTSMIGELQAFTQSPAVVLRCPGCGQVMLRVAQMPGATLLDTRGVMYLRIPGQG